MTVSEALQLSALKGAKVLTKNSALEENTITWVSVIEVPVEEFIRPGEFVVSTGMNVGHNPSLLAKFVKDVANGSPAALAIAVGHYTPAVPRRIVKEAESRGLMLIELPWKIRFSEISEAILRSLMLEQAATRSLDDFVWSLASNNLTEDTAVSRGKQFGFELKRSYVAITGRVSNASNLPSARAQTNARLVESTCKRIAQEHQLYWLGSVVGDTVIGYLELPRVKQRARALLGRVSAHLKEQGTISWGIGRVCRELREFSSSYQDSGIACDLGRKARGEGAITDVSDILGDRILLKMRHDADAFMLLERYVEPLKRAPRMQLLPTLETYFENDCNASATARQLRISRQALLYRLAKAESLLDSDLTSYGQRFALSLSLRLNKLQQS